MSDTELLEETIGFARIDGRKRKYYRTANGELANIVKVLADELDEMTHQRNQYRDKYLSHKYSDIQSPAQRLQYVSEIVVMFPTAFTAEVAQRLNISERHAGRLIFAAREADFLASGKKNS